eukprot:m51a1_g869 hypothetical protein (792) ;mRNA; f:824327-828370
MAEPSPASAPSALPHVDSSNRNDTTVWCRVCGCKILDPRTAELVQREIVLPRSKRGSGDDTLQNFWHLTDMMTFVNIGFTNVIDSNGTTKRLLTCADCEREVLGQHNRSHIPVLNRAASTAWNIPAPARSRQSGATWASAPAPSALDTIRLGFARQLARPPARASARGNGGAAQKPAAGPAVAKMTQLPRPLPLPPVRADTPQPCCAPAKQRPRASSQLSRDPQPRVLRSVLPSDAPAAAAAIACPEASVAADGCALSPSAASSAPSSEFVIRTSVILELMDDDGPDAESPPRHSYKEALHRLEAKLPLDWLAADLPDLSDDDDDDEFDEYGEGFRHAVSEEDESDEDEDSAPQETRSALVFERLSALLPLDHDLPPLRPPVAAAAAGPACAHRLARDDECMSRDDEFASLASAPEFECESVGDEGDEGDDTAHRRRWRETRLSRCTPVRSLGCSRFPADSATPKERLVQEQDTEDADTDGGEATVAAAAIPALFSRARAVVADELDATADTEDDAPQETRCAAAFERLSVLAPLPRPPLRLPAAPAVPGSGPLGAGGSEMESPPDECEKDGDSVHRDDDGPESESESELESDGHEDDSDAEAAPATPGRRETQQSRCTPFRPRGIAVSPAATGVGALVITEHETLVRLRADPDAVDSIDGDAPGTALCPSPRSVAVELKSDTRTTSCSPSRTASAPEHDPADPVSSSKANAPSDACLLWSCLAITSLVLLSFCPDLLGSLLLASVVVVCAFIAQDPVAVADEAEPMGPRHRGKRACSASSPLCSTRFSIL